MEYALFCFRISWVIPYNIKFLRVGAAAKLTVPSGKSGSLVFYGAYGMNGIEDVLMDYQLLATLQGGMPLVPI